MNADPFTGALRDRAGEHTPTVSVVMTTYNSAAWLARAVESVLDQQTSFGVELIISDDCSQDATVALAQAYAARHPHVVRVVERSANVGMMRNYFESFAAARGRYIAWLDADDYWTEPQKLARQVAALEADPMLMLCAHYVRWVIRQPGETQVTVERERYPVGIEPGRYGMQEILHRNFVPSPSIVFRREIAADLPAWYLDIAPTTDWPLHVLAARAGGILLLDGVMADYCLTPTSAYWGKGQEQWYINDARFFEYVGSLVPAGYLPQVAQERAARLESLSYHRRTAGDLTGARQAAELALRTGGTAAGFWRRVRLWIASTVYESGLRSVRNSRSA